MGAGGSWYWQSLFKLSGIMEDYFVPRSWLVCLSSPLPPFSFLFLVVADTLGKQFVSHLIAFEKLKSRNDNRPGLGMRTVGTLTP